MSNKEKGPVEPTWAQERAEEKRIEKNRTCIAIAVALLSASLAVFWYCKGNSSDLAHGYNQALFAALVATAVVAGARATEGPARDPQGGKRNSLPPASQLARSWLSCFIAVATVFLLGQLIEKVSTAPEQSSDIQSGTTVSGTLTATTGDQTESVEIAGPTKD